MDFNNKGKSMNTSVPSMAIRFNATAEEIEEIFTNEEEQSDRVNDSILPTEKPTEVETSPRRSILPILGKRSTSIDTNSTSAQDSSPPSDPWRFLSDIKGKITKSVEVKLTEYKSRTLEGDGSPKLSKPVKDSKENSSLSDSEEASESSISRTCGIVSTTEGVEMSSDDETPSLSEEDKANNDNTQSLNASSGTSLRQRFRVTNTKKNTTKEGSLGAEFLENIQKITDGVPGPETSDIESGVDVLADMAVSNFEVDSEQVLNIRQVSGSDIRSAEIEGAEETVRTIFSPTGFVDLRGTGPEPIIWYKVLYDCKWIILTTTCLILYFCLPFSTYASGFIAGALVVSVFWSLYVKIYFDKLPLRPPALSKAMNIMEIPAIKEYQPLTKYEGWVNEYPEEYNPATYHVSQTQSVYLRLQGNFLKVSHTRQKIPKRAMWNEPEHKLVFTRHRIYNLLGAKVTLLPEGLAKVRHWSKKYPICIRLNKDQVNFEEPVKKVKEHKGKEVKVAEKKSDTVIEPQVFSKLVENEEESSTFLPVLTEESGSKEDIAESESCSEILPSESKSITSELRSLLSSEIRSIVQSDSGSFQQADAKSQLQSDSGTLVQSDSKSLVQSDSRYDFDDDEDEVSNVMEWNVIALSAQDSPDETRLYLFGRTGREKEDWFRRLRYATKKETEDDKTVTHAEYLSYMRNNNIFCEDLGPASLQSLLGSQDNVWVNALLARVFFDCAREETTIQRIKERIQRKLASVRLPHFIQELYCEQLNLGTTSPKILGSSKPVLNDRGIWVDLDISYEGLVVFILQTKVNLFKLKLPHEASEKSEERSAIFHSDVDDSAESTTDEEPVRVIATTPVLDAKGLPLPGVGGTSNRSKKIMKMVDRIAESKFFQAATENKYIKKAMQEFSNTNLRLKVEVKKCVGKLVINIPAPPTDRVWLGFREPPELMISAFPIVGDRNISFMRVTTWIEKKIYKEFQKIFVIPNMEDITIPVMCPKLPE